MCRNFATSQLKSMWNKCLPRNDNALLQFQENRKKSAIRCNKKSGYCCTCDGCLVVACSITGVSFRTTLQLRSTSLQLRHFHWMENGNVEMNNIVLPYINEEMHSRKVTESLIVAQGVCSSYLLLSYMVLTLPVEYKKSVELCGKLERPFVYVYSSMVVHPYATKVVVLCRISWGSISW